MPAIVLQQVSSHFARKNARGTLEKPDAIKHLAAYLDSETSKDLAEACSDGTVRIWGAKQERSHQFFKMPARNSIVLFRRGAIVFAHGAIAATTINEPLAAYLWNHDVDGETWPLVFFLKRLVTVHKKASRLNEILGRKPNDNWQGMTAINVGDSPRLKEYFAREFAPDA